MITADEGAHAPSWYEVPGALYEHMHTGTLVLGIGYLQFTHLGSFMADDQAKASKNAKEGGDGGESENKSSYVTFPNIVPSSYRVLSPSVIEPCCRLHFMRAHLQRNYSFVWQELG